MKSINIICSYRFPGPSAAAQRVEAFVKTFSRNNKVKVFTLDDENSNHGSENIFNENVSIYYVKHFQYNKTNFFKRSFNEAVVSYKLLKLSRKFETDYCIITIPFMFLIQAGILFGGKTRKVLDIRDLVWEYLPENTYFRRFIKKCIRKFMLFFIARYDHISTSNAGEQELILAETGHRSVHLISNGISKSRFDKVSNLLINVKSDGTPIISYVGNIGLAQRLDTLVDAAKEMKQVRFIIAGKGNDQKRVEQYAKDHSLENVEFAGLLTHDEILKLYTKSHILYAQLDKSFAYAVPSKLYEYLSTGLPLIYGGTGTAVSVLSQFEQVSIIPPCNSRELISAIKNILKKPLLKSENNIQFIKDNYIRENHCIQLFEIISIYEQKNEMSL